MAQVALIRPATVPETFRISGLNTVVFPSDATNVDIPAGAFVVASGGALAEAARNASDILTETSIFGLTNEKFSVAMKPVGSIPIRQTGISVTLALPGIVFECNYHGNGGPNTISFSLVGSTLSVKRLASGVYVAVPFVTGTAKFVVVGLVDSAGTTFGRILVAPDAAQRLYK